MEKKQQENFIMLPTVDFCFKELMQNAKVRKGFIAALLKISPESIEATTLLPTIMDRQYEDDKLCILDVRVQLMNKTQLDLEMQVSYFAYWDERVLLYLCKMYVEQIKMGDDYDSLQKCIHVSILDFIQFPEDEECYRSIHLRDDKTGELYSDKLELHVLELKKLPKEVKTGEDIITWMKFFSGKSKEEFERMAKTNEYVDEAYQALMKLSADERKKLEYEAREKAVRDYNSQMRSAEKRGIELGEKHGIESLVETCQELGASEKYILTKLITDFNVTSEQAKTYLSEHSNSDNRGLE